MRNLRKLSSATGKIANRFHKKMNVQKKSYIASPPWSQCVSYNDILKLWGQRWEFITSLSWAFYCFTIYDRVREQSPFPVELLFSLDYQEFMFSRFPKLNTSLFPSSVCATCNITLCWCMHWQVKIRLPKCHYSSLLLSCLNKSVLF